jgi:hypothetical protein
MLLPNNARHNRSRCSSSRLRWRVITIPFEAVARTKAIRVSVYFAQEETRHDP